MQTRSRRWAGMASIAFVLLAGIAICRLEARPRPNGVSPAASSDVAIDADDIGGVVTSSNGPEAGVWVIAETADLGTKFREIVITNDRGQYLLPDLPKANYKVWVRGYGLVDSAPVNAAPGQELALAAVSRRHAARGGRILSGELLGFAAERAFQERVSHDALRLSVFRDPHAG